MEDEVRPLRLPGRDRNEPPFLRGQVADTGQASGLVLSGGGITVAGQRRIHTGFAAHKRLPGFPGTGEAYFTGAWLAMSEVLDASRARQQASTEGQVCYR
jgi:hypothetical protein